MDSGGDSSRGNSGRSTPAARGGKRKAHSGLGQQNAPSVPAHATLAKARSVDVVGFVEARSFEINALQRSLEAAKTSGNARAFQTLPRHLRRRAASHNVKRIPVRLREKAISEMKKSAQSSKNLKNSDQLTNGKKASRYKRRRTRTVREEYELRQSGKRWLETHVWHAKRMHMKEMWGTMIAETPNERSHRAAYRAAMERTYIQDVSFYATIEITGTETDIFRLLRTMTTPIDPTISKKRYLDGNRVLPLTLYRVGKYPLAALGPAVALWKPMFGTAATGDADGRRMLWLRAHPANAADISAELAAAREQCGFGGLEIGIADITADLVSFELLGNQSTPMLAEVLGHAVDPRSRGSDILHLIRNVPSPACLPESAVIALHVHDPRLRFPYKLNTGNSSLATDEQQRLDKLLIEWPADAAFSDFGDSEGIWNRSRSAESLRNRLSDHELNERRRRQLVPGTKLDPDPAIDVTVPLLLIRSGPEMLLGSQVSNAGSSFVDNLAHGWTLIAPKGWGMPLLLSLVFAGARTQGLQERLHIGFEAGLPS
ncbi:Ribonucleases P/MRP protein subunit pop1, partial [Dipsacomyces acuminosporus]